jgi:hypothetical protein
LKLKIHPIGVSPFGILLPVQAELATQWPIGPNREILAEHSAELSSRRPLRLARQKNPTEKSLYKDIVCHYSVNLYRWLMMASWWRRNIV